MNLRRYARPDTIAGFVALSIGAYVFLGTLRLIVHCWSPVPVFDQWDNLITGRDVTWRWLVSQNYSVDHRLLFPRLIFLADYWLAGETNRVNFAASPIIQAGLVLLMVRLARGAGFRARAETTWAAGVALALLFWAAQHENYIWGFQSQFFLVQLTAVAAFSFVAMEPTTATTALAILLESVSVFTMANGVLVPVLALALAIWLGRRRQLIFLAAAAVVLLGLYSVHLQSPWFRLKLDEAPHRLGDIMAFVTAQLGGPFGETIGWLFSCPPLGVAIGCGAVGLAALAALGYGLLVRRRDVPAPVVALFSTACFAVGTSFLICIGRMRLLGVAYALTSRYATPALLFWVALFLLAGFRLGRRRTMLWASPALLLALLGQQHFSAEAEAIAEGRAVAAPAIAANVADTDVLHAIYWLDESTPLRERSRLQASRTSIFAQPWLSWAGSRLADHLPVVDGSLCQGSFDTAREVGDELHSGWRVSGRARDCRGKPPARIVLADPSGTVVGYALGRIHAKTAGGSTAAGQADGDWWLGAIHAADPRQVTAFAVLSDGRACPLGPARRAIGAPRLVLSAALPAGLPADGFIESVTLTDRARLTGWGLLQADEGTRRVLVDTNLPVKSGRMSTPDRSDVASSKHDGRLLHSGIEVTLELDPSQPMPARPRLCLWTDDPVFGRARLQMPSRPDLCTP